MESKQAAHGRLRLLPPLLIASVFLNLLLLLGCLPPIPRRLQSTATGGGGGGGGGEGGSPVEVGGGVLLLEPHWTSAAAAEAEAVAAISCSGHGCAFLDGVLAGGKGLPRCECNTCYGGDDCSRLLPDCPADVNSGDPLFLEAYWRRHASASAVVLSGWHRMSYQATGKNFISQELETHIRLLHKVVGNAVADGKFIVFGAGSTQLFNALVYALSTVDDSNNDTSSSSSPALVVATAPYYPVYKSQTIMFDGRKYEWKGSTSSGWVQNSTTNQSDSKLIEFVTSPNNPDGGLRQSVVRGARVINDHAYYWPHYSAIPAAADEDIMAFTASKISGHASSRFGWALIKDEKVYERMTRYMLLNSMGVSRDTQLRVLKLLKVMIGEADDNIFEFGYKTLKERWRKLHAVVSNSSNRFSLQNLSPQFCSYFNETRDPSPAYAWVKCEREEDADCSAVLKKAGIISRTGTLFEADGRYTRLSLIKTDDDMDLLLKRLQTLVDSTNSKQENGEEEEEEEEEGDTVVAATA